MPTKRTFNLEVIKVIDESTKRFKTEEQSAMHYNHGDRWHFSDVMRWSYERTTRSPRGKCVDESKNEGAPNKQ
ncbi:hypothetical protein CAEBREN_24331 [Caenorhabditis brenneri]|uniref:Uncharacterized protein n=1 Tax=Caenorhabditis brenneri TaxID=135651 RepID=G0P852_CAEBE|nr:hypothetical protein CAEBREN_24331 [Caenorhabditis brenneri]